MKTITFEPKRPLVAASEWTGLVARIAFAALFFASGWVKAADLPAVAARVAGVGLPMGSELAGTALAADLIGATMLLAGFQTRWFALLMAGYASVSAVLFHAFWAMPAGPEPTRAMLLFFMDGAIACGLLHLAATGPGRFSIDASRDRRREQPWLPPPLNDLESGSAAAPATTGAGPRRRAY